MAYPGAGPEALGTEVLTGPAELDGEFTIKEAKAPGTGAAYAGTVLMEPLEGMIENDPTFALTWTMGEMKVGGVGFRHEDKLVVAAGAKGFAVMNLSTNDVNLIGDYVTGTEVKGYYTLTK